MFKVIKQLSIIIVVMVSSQQYTSAQIIKEKKWTNSNFASILQYSDNEYIYVGTEANKDRYENNITLTNKDLQGDIKWKKTIEWDFYCIVRDAEILPNKNIIITGSARKSTYQSYPFLILTDSKGDTLWTRYYETGHQAEAVIQTFDGGYLFAYYSDGSGLMKLNSEGDPIWSKKIGNGKPYGLAETSEAVYLMVDDEDDNVVLSSIDSDGEVLWKRIFGGEGRDQPADVINASNGDDYLFAGRSYSNETGDDFFIGLLDCFGYVNWTKTFGGNGTDVCYDLMESSDGDFIAVGSSNSFNDEGRFDFYAVKFDSYGKTVWEKTFPNMDAEDYSAQNIFETSYGSYLVAGPKTTEFNSSKESYIVEFIFPTQFDISFESDKQTISDPPYTVQFTNNTANSQYFDFVWHFGDGESLTSNEKTVYHEYKEDGMYDVKLEAFENDFGSSDSVIYESYIDIKGVSTSTFSTKYDQATSLNIYPNPFSEKTTISFNNPENDSHNLRIIDMEGKLIKEINNFQGSSIEFSRNNIPSGIYFLELYGKTISRAKMLIK